MDDQRYSPLSANKRFAQIGLGWAGLVIWAGSRLVCRDGGCLAGRRYSSTSYSFRALINALTRDWVSRFAALFSRSRYVCLVES